MEKKGRLFGSLKNDPSASRKCPTHTAQASFQQRETRLGTLLGSVSWRELVAVAQSQGASARLCRYPRRLQGKKLDSHRLDFFLASLLRQAMAVRKMWLGEVYGRGRLCTFPLHWNRNLFSLLAMTLPRQKSPRVDFNSGRPWHAASLVN